MMIAVYNHDNETLQLEDELRSAGIDFVSYPPTGKAVADILIMHCSEEAATGDIVTRRQLLSGESVPDKLREQGILIFVSSVGLEESIAPDPKGRFFMFGIRKAVSKSSRGRPTLLTKQEWSAIFGWAAKAQGKKQLHELEALASTAVKRLLWNGNEERRFSRALAVLCQGYLAVYRRKSSSASLSVQDGRWWLRPFQKTLGTKSTPRLCQLIHDEWNDCPAEVELLLKRIQGGTVDKPAVVVRAYQAMCSPCRSKPNATATSRNDSAIIPPAKMLLVGDGLETATLAHCLVLFTEAVQIAPAALKKQAGRLDSDSNAVFVLGLDGNTRAVWSSLSHLRLKQRWSGRVLIVLSPDQKRQFDENVFVQWQDSKHPAHGFVSRPINLDALLQSANALRPYRKYAFSDYLDLVKAESGFNQAVTMWKKLQTTTNRQLEGRNLARLFLGMKDSVRRCIMKHSEESLLTKWLHRRKARRQVWMVALENIMARIQ